MYIERQLENGNSVYELPFYNYIAFYYYYFTIISLLFFPYYLDNDLDASNMKNKDRVDLQIEPESIPTDSKPANGKTRKRRFYEASGLNIDPYHKKPKMGKSTRIPLSDERRTKVPNSLKKAQQHDFLWTSDLTFNRQSGNKPMWLTGIPVMVHGKRACKKFGI